MPRFAFAGLALVVLLGALSAQSPKAAKGPLDAVPGYTKVTIEGFTVLVADEATNADTSKYERKPMAVLELELKTISGMLNEKTLKLLQKLPIWVEWDENRLLGNGRAGGAVAVYYGGHQANLLADGKHPLKSKTVTILSLRSLTAEHQPKTDSGRCILLHEFAHAVHDQLVGRENPAVKAAYRQAMERKLYDKEAYLATNDAEFFAELTCAYFDQLGTYPRTRDELKKHDAVGYKMVHDIWGGAAKKPAPGTTAKRVGLLEKNGSDKFDLSVTVDQLRFRGHLHGPEIAPEKLKGSVVLVGYWNDNDPAVVGKFGQAAQELAPYGGRVVTSMAGNGLDPNRIKEEMDRRGVEITSMNVVFVPEKGTDRASTQPSPHALVFDADGTCIFRGSTFDALPHMRAAVARKLLADLEDPPAGLAKATDALTGGEPLLDALPKLTALFSSTDPATASAAKSLHAKLLAPATDALADATAKKKTEPVAAYFAAERIAASYKGTPVAAKANALAQSLAGDPAVDKELRARRAAEPIFRVEKALSGSAGSFDPTSQRFQVENAAALNQMRAAIEKLRKQFPGTRALADAEKAARPYGILP